MTRPTTLWRLKRRAASCTPEPTSTEQLLRRAATQRRRKQARQAMLTLRAACAREDGDPRLWALYGAQCARLGKREEARAAFERALWLRGRARQHGRVRVLQELIERAGERHRWVA